MRRLRLLSSSFTLTRASILGAIVSAALLSGCKGAPEPAAPFADSTQFLPVPQPAPGTALGSIAGFVIDSSDECIIGARVEILDGPRAGESFVQTMCGFWDYGDDLGYSFSNLSVGIPVTLRASATGYYSVVQRATPTNPFSYTTMIVLTKGP